MEPIIFGEHGSVVGWGTMQQVAGSIPDEVTGFFNSSNPSSLTLWPWGRLSLQHKWVPGILRGVKGGWPVRLTTSTTSVPRLSRKCGSLDVSQLYGLPRTVAGIVLLFIRHNSSLSMWEISDELLEVDTGMWNLARLQNRFFRLPRSTL
jgi:hypothetical protein